MTRKKTVNDNDTNCNLNCINKLAETPSLNTTRKDAADIIQTNDKKLRTTNGALNKVDGIYQPLHTDFMPTMKRKKWINKPKKNGSFPVFRWPSWSSHFNFHGIR